MPESSFNYETLSFYYNTTTSIVPFALAFTLFMGMVMLLVPRRMALVPFIFATCYMTFGQRLVLAGLDFTMMRILVIFGWMRLILRGEIYPLRLNVIDKLIIVWIIVKIAAYTLLWQTSGAFINRLGNAYDTVGMYFMFRFLIHDFEDIKHLFKILVLVMVPLALLMLIEKSTGRNLFSILGGVPEITHVREGRLRCQGPFRHPILVGTLGAALMPFCVPLLWQHRGTRFIGLIGIISTTLVTITSASSGPFLSYFIGVAALAMWPLRGFTRIIKWGTVVTVIGLHTAMNAPVWFVFARVGVVAGSTGWHRSYLIDRAIAHFTEWWLLGTKYTHHWGWNLWDVTSEYINEGVKGGFLAMVLLISIMAFCFKALGRTLQSIEASPFSTKIYFWSLRASLLVHVVSFLSVSYFDQIIAFWYLLLAMISPFSGYVYWAIEQPQKQAIPASPSFGALAAKPAI